METANLQIVEVPKKKRGRPVGSVDLKVQEEKHNYSENQIAKLQRRKDRLQVELYLIEEKMGNHSCNLIAK